MRRRARPLLIGVVLAASGVFGAAGWAAHAAHVAPAAVSEEQATSGASGLTGDELQVYEEGVPYAAVIDEIDELLGDDPGLASMAAANDRNAVVIQARADWGDETQRQLDEIVERAATDHGVTVEIIDVRYGEDEITALWDEVVEAAAQRGVTVIEGGGHATAGTLSFVGSGIETGSEALVVLDELTKQIVGDEFDAVVGEPTPDTARFSS